MLNYQKSKKKEYDWEITMPDNLDFRFKNRTL